MMHTKLSKIGITGGIGSGKSRVCKIFAALGYAVYYADERAKKLMTTKPEIIEGLKDLFGVSAYLPDGRLNRPYIGEIVFNDPARLQQLNALVHPQTRRDFVQWYRSLLGRYEKPFVLKEAAILYESGAYQEADAVITVYAPTSVRLRRVVERDQTTPEAVLQRMEKQWPESEKLRRADYVIYNDGEHALIPQVLEIIQALH